MNQGVGMSKIDGMLIMVDYDDKSKELRKEMNQQVLLLVQAETSIIVFRVDR